MKSSNVVAAIFSIAVSALAVPLAVAADQAAGWYVGGSIGQSRVNYSSSTLVSDLAAGGITGTGTVSTNDTAGKLFVGYQFNPNLALEGGYFNMGTFLKANGTFTKPAPGGTFAATAKGQGGNFDVVGMLPFGQGFAGIGRLGVAYFETKAEATASVAGFSGYSNATSNKTVVDAGLGLQYEFTKSVAGRLEWQRYFKVGNSNTGSGDVDFYSLGITVKF